MDKYDSFIADVIEKTNKGIIIWDAVSPGKYFDFIFQAPHAYQAFVAKYPKGERTYTLVFVNKKIPIHQEDLDVVVETHYTDILVIEGAVLIITLSNSFISDRDILALQLEIEDKCQSAKNLFKGFE